MAGDADGDGSRNRTGELYGFSSRSISSPLQAALYLLPRQPAASTSPLAHAHTHALTHMHTHSDTYMQSPALTRTHAHSHTHTHTYTHSHALTHSYSQSHSPEVRLSVSRSPRDPISRVSLPVWPLSRRARPSRSIRFVNNDRIPPSLRPNAVTQRPRRRGVPRVCTRVPVRVSVRF